MSQHDREERLTETTHREMTAILASDLGIESDQVLGFVIISVVNPKAMNPEIDALPDEFMPVVRTSMSGRLTTYILNVAAAETLLHSEDGMGLGDMCDCPEHDK